MKIKMLAAQSGSPDGITVCRYEKGSEYDVPETLGGVFVKEGWAKKICPRSSTKNAGAAPENKTVKPRSKVRKKS